MKDIINCKGRNERPSDGQDDVSFAGIVEGPRKRVAYNCVAKIYMHWIVFITKLVVLILNKQLLLVLEQETANEVMTGEKRAE